MMMGEGAGIFLQAIYFVILAGFLGAVQYDIFAGAFAFTIIGRHIAPSEQACRYSMVRVNQNTPLTIGLSIEVWRIRSRRGV
jgi:hypothetical protein